ncbi:MAG: DUF167 domain-containing protein [Cyanobium sp.]
MTVRPPVGTAAAGQATGGGQDSSRGVALWVQPRASRDAVIGEHAGRVAIRLQAPPVDGAANAALVCFLARRLDCPPGTVRLLRGQTGRRKLVAVDGMTAAELRSRLLALSGS